MKRIQIITGFIAILVLVGCSRSNSTTTKDAVGNVLPNTKSNYQATISAQLDQSVVSSNAPLPSLTVVAAQVVTEAVAPQPAPEIYRMVSSRDDGITFFSRCSSEELRADGKLYFEGYTLGIVCTNGKEIDIDLASGTVNGGLIQTAKYGTLLVTNWGQTANDVGIFAKESQIKKLHELQSSGNP